MRGELTKDLPNTLHTVARIGYEVVEFYSSYFGWTFPFAKDVRAQIDDLGLRCFSTHNGFESLMSGETMAKAVELNQILGARHIIMASAPRTTRNADDWKRLCEHLTTAVEELRPHGLSPGFTTIKWSGCLSRVARAWWTSSRRTRRRNLFCSSTWAPASRQGRTRMALS